MRRVTLTPAFGLLALTQVVALGCSGDDPQGLRSADPTIPVLIAPVEGAIMDNGCMDFSDPMVWDFDWTDVGGATAYHLYVTGDDAIAPAIDATVAESRFHLGGVSYVVPRNATGWRWRVRARIGGEWMAWSPERTFDVELLNSDC